MTGLGFKRIKLTRKEAETTSAPTTLTTLLLGAFGEIEKSHDSILYAECFLSEELYRVLLEEQQQAVRYQREKFPDLANAKVFQYYGVYYKNDFRLPKGTAQIFIEAKYQKVRPEGIERQQYTLEVTPHADR